MSRRGGGITARLIAVAVLLLVAVPAASARRDGAPVARIKAIEKQLDGPSAAGYWTSDVKRAKADLADLDSALREVDKAERAGMHHADAERLRDRVVRARHWLVVAVSLFHHGGSANAQLARAAIREGSELALFARAELRELEAEARLPSVRFEQLAQWLESAVRDEFDGAFRLAGGLHATADDRASARKSLYLSRAALQEFRQFVGAANEQGKIQDDDYDAMRKVLATALAGDDAAAVDLEEHGFGKPVQAHAEIVRNLGRKLELFKKLTLSMSEPATPPKVKEDRVFTGSGILARGAPEAVCAYIKGPPGQTGKVWIRSAHTPPDPVVVPQEKRFTLDAHGLALVSFTVPPHGGANGTSWPIYVQIDRNEPDKTVRHEGTDVVPEIHDSPAWGLPPCNPG